MNPDPHFEETPVPLDADGFPSDPVLRVGDQQLDAALHALLEPESAARAFTESVMARLVPVAKQKPVRWASAAVAWRIAAVFAVIGVTLALLRPLIPSPGTNVAFQSANGSSATFSTAFQVDADDSFSIGMDARAVRLPPAGLAPYSQSSFTLVSYLEPVEPPASPDLWLPIGTVSR